MLCADLGRHGAPMRRGKDPGRRPVSGAAVVACRPMGWLFGVYVSGGQFGSWRGRERLKVRRESWLPGDT